MRRRAAGLIAVLAALGPPRAPAQDAASADLKRGTPVRVMRIQSGGERSELARGTLERLAPDTVVFTVAGDSVASMVLGAGRELEARTGHESSVIQGALLGFLVGGIAGWAIGAESYQPCEGTGLSCIGDFGAGPHIAGSIALYGMAGALLGGALGSQLRRDTWQAVGRGPTFTVVAQPAARGMRLGALLRF
jgi:hypothetical protein